MVNCRYCGKMYTKKDSHKGYCIKCLKDLTEVTRALKIYSRYRSETSCTLCGLPKLEADTICSQCLKEIVENNQATVQSLSNQEDIVSLRCWRVDRDGGETVARFISKKDAKKVALRVNGNATEEVWSIHRTLASWVESTSPEVAQHALAKLTNLEKLALGISEL